MVVFTCSHCGDSIQKPKVEKHYDTKCRNKFPDLCCVDCLKDFRGDDYKVHTKCVTEAERYGGKGFVAKPNQNKGEQKQNAWVEIVQSVLSENSTMSSSIRQLLERVSKQPNTPRKRPKFINFIRSMDYRISMSDTEGAWDLISAKLNLLKPVTQQKAPLKESEEENTTDNKNEVMDVSEEPNANKKDKKKGKKLKDISNGVDEHEDKSPIEMNGKSLEESEEKNTADNKSEAMDVDKEPNVNKKEKKKGKKLKDISNGIDQHEDKNPIEIKEREKKNMSNGVDVHEEKSSIEMNVKSSKESKEKNAADNNSEAMEVDKEPNVNKKEKKGKKLKDISNGINRHEDKNLIEIKKKKNKNISNGINFHEDKNPIEMNGKKNKKKRKLSEDTYSENKVDEMVDEPVAKKIKGASGEFHWTGAILSVIGSKGKDIKLKKLQKRVLNEYCAVKGVSEISDRIVKKFSKSLYKIQDIKIENEKVRLLTKGE